MRNLIVVWVLCAIGLSILFGCGKSPTDIDCYDSFDEFDMSSLNIAYPANEVISLSLVEGFEYKVNETFPLLVNNHSDKYIWIPKGYFQTIQRQTWREDTYQNLYDCLNRDLEFDILLPPRGLEEAPKELLFNFFIDNPKETENIKIVISGFNYVDEKICNLAFPAIIDITLHQ